MRLEILTADVLEALNAQEIYQTVQEHSLGEFDELAQKYRAEWDGFMKAERIDEMIESHRRMRMMRGFCRLKSMNATIEQIEEALEYDAKIKEELERERTEALGQKK